mmetsp:Transcript_29367/g.34941  ORF Transcript_29367/g.34941 Transcript_29367/m.34941 type:complete len:270 (+) Transcript_29367:626-1435(+)
MEGRENAGRLGGFNSGAENLGTENSGALKLGNSGAANLGNSGALNFGTDNSLLLLSLAFLLLLSSLLGADKISGAANLGNSGAVNLGNSGEVNLGNLGGALLLLSLFLGADKISGAANLGAFSSTFLLDFPSSGTERNFWAEKSGAESFGAAAGFLGVVAAAGTIFVAIGGVVMRLLLSPPKGLLNAIAVNKVRPATPPPIVVDAAFSSPLGSISLMEVPNCDTVFSNSWGSSMPFVTPLIFVATSSRGPFVIRSKSRNNCFPSFVYSI